MFKTDKELVLQITTSVSSSFDDYNKPLSMEPYKLELPVVVMWSIAACSLVHAK
jgi:hypothetical protein